MKRNKALILISAVLLAVSLLAGSAQAGARFGGGVHYLRTLGEIKTISGIDENSLGFWGSLSFAGPMLRLEVDLEWVPNYAGTDESLFQPQAYLLLGDFIYGGLGIGIGNLYGEWHKKPFFALRAGLLVKPANFELDLFTSYRFQTFDTLQFPSNDDFDSLTFGALIRFGD